MIRGVLALALLLLGGAAHWEKGAPLPVPRSEVAAAVVGGEIAVVGGFTADGASSREVDAYSPAHDTWRRLPDLPVGVNHTMAAASRGRLYVVGGYGDAGRRLRGAFVLERGSWRTLRPLPAVRAAGGAAVVDGRLFVVGGVGPVGLAKSAYALDLARGRWSSVPAPTRREHLAVTSMRGRVYAIGGRTAGFDTNLALAESYLPGSRRWRRLSPVPEPRGGTGAAVLGGEIVSIGGEAPQGTIASVYAFSPATARWRRLPDLPTPRHGLAVAASGGRVYVIGGGTSPGLSVSAATEVLVP